MTTKVTQLKLMSDTIHPKHAFLLLGCVLFGLLFGVILGRQMVFNDQVQYYKFKSDAYQLFLVKQSIIARDSLNVDLYNTYATAINRFNNQAYEYGRPVVQDTIASKFSMPLLSTTKPGARTPETKGE